jgi:hypothetical protein
MPLRSVYEISMDDSKVRDFFDAFSQHREEVGGAGEEWVKAFQRAGTAAKGVNDYLKQFESEFKDLSTAATKSAKDQGAAMDEVAEATRKAATWQAQFGAAISTGSHHLGTAAKSARSIAGDLAEGTRWMMKWTGISTAVGGLVGAGSLFGLDRLAAGAGNRRFAAQGLGIPNSTEQQAFGLAYSRVVNPDAFLGNVASARSDYNKAKTWVSLGISQAQLQNLDTVDLAKLALERMQAKWGSLSDHSVQTAEAFGLNNLGSMEDLRRLLTADQGLGKERSQYNQLNRQLYVPDNEQRAWQDFDIQLHAAGDKITNAFLDSFGKAHLPEELSKLSGAAAAAIWTFLDAPQLKVWLDELGTGLKNTATFLTSDDFQKDIHEFVAGIGAIAGAVKWAENLLPDVYKKSLGIIPDPDKGTTQYNPATGWHKGPGDWTWHFGPPPPGAKVIGSGGNTAPIGPPGTQSTPPLSAGASNYLAQNGQLDNTQAGPGIGMGWTPGDYPNAPVETQQTISHPERNNPGNLRASTTQLNALGRVTQPGAAFDSWDTPEHGIQARIRTYMSYLNRGVNTISGIANLSGPASDGNNVASEIASYRQALGGKYAGEGGENLPIDLSPENLRRLAAGGLSIEAGGGGKWLPKGYGVPAIDQALKGLTSGSPLGPSSGGGGKGGAASAVDDMMTMAGLDRADPRVRAFIQQNGGDLDPRAAAWCAAFVGASLQHEGIGGGKGDLATNWETFGAGVNPGNVKKGDVIVLPRGLGPGQMGGHVGMATGEVDPQGRIRMIQGNKGGKVDYSWENPDDVMVRRAFVDEFKRALREGNPVAPADPPSSAPRFSPTQSGGVSGSVGNGPKVSIAVHNMTGGSAIISADQLAHQ